MRKFFADFVRKRFAGEEKNHELTPMNSNQGVRMAAAGERGIQRWYEGSFKDRLKQVIDKNYSNRDAVFVSFTPEILEEAGFVKLPIVMGIRHCRLNYCTADEFEKNFGVMRQGEHAHGLHNYLVDVVNGLNNPLAILVNKRPHAKPGSVVVITDVNVKGHKVVVPVLIDAEQNADNSHIDTHLILTVYDSNDWVNDFLNPAIEEEKKGIGIFYFDTKKADRYRVLSKKKEQTSNGFWHKITDDVSQVKGIAKKQTDTSQFKEWFGDSQVVDENGEPLVVDGLFLNLDKNPVNYGVFSWAEKLVDKIHAAEEKTNTKLRSQEFFYVNDQKLCDEIGLLSGQDSVVLDAIYDGKKPVYRIAFRYGDVPECGLSTNFRDNYYENGVSVVKSVAELNTKKTYYSLFFHDKDYCIVGGWDLGNHGADGEMLLSYAKRLGKAEDVGKIAKSATDNVGTFDRNNPDIRYSVERFSEEEMGVLSEACREWVSKNFYNTNDEQKLQFFTDRGLTQVKTVEQAREIMLSALSAIRIERGRKAAKNRQAQAKLEKKQFAMQHPLYDFVNDFAGLRE